MHEMSVTFAHSTAYESAEVRAVLADPLTRNNDVRGCYAPRFAELELALVGVDLARRDRVLFTGLRRAARLGDALAVLVLRDLGSSPDAFRDTVSPLMLACKHGYALCVELLIALGAEVNRKHRSLSALHHACTAMRIECIHVLLSHGASTETYPRYCMSALTLACGHGFVCGVRALLHARARVDEHAMHVTVARRDVDVLQVLIKYGGDVDARSVTGATPLVKLCTASRHADWNVIRCAQLLVDARADVDARALNGDGALTGALRAGGASEHLVTLLLRAGARPAPLHDLGGAAVLPAAAQLAINVMSGWTPTRHQLFGAADRAHARFLMFVGAQLGARHGYDLMHAWTDQVMMRCIVCQPMFL